MFKFEEQADILESFSDLLEVKYTHYLLSKEKPSCDDLKIIQKFVDWLRQDIKEDIEAPRGKFGLSYAEARSLAIARRGLDDY